MFAISNFLDDLEISNVSQRFINDSTGPWDKENDFYCIDFETKNVKYYIVIALDKDGVYYPEIICHEDEEEKNCPFCKSFDVCTGLSPYASELFERLKEQTPGRIIWLYTPYKIL